MKSKYSLTLLQGSDIYSPFVLSLYDFFVLRFSNRYLWKCPTKELVSLYNRNVSGEHLDIGVGTGYYLSVARFPMSNPQITLVDLNKNSLSVAANRIEQLKPIQVIANVLEDLPLEQKYSSASLCYLLHCLAGGIKTKAQVFDRVSNVVRDKGRVFGATIVSGVNGSNLAAKALATFYNKVGIFSNLDDTIEDVTSEFQKRFTDTTIRIFGSVLLFEGTVKK